MYKASPTGLFLLEALLINLPLYYATLTTCISGTSLHQTQLINEMKTSGCANAINSPEFLIIIQTTIWLQ